MSNQPDWFAKAQAEQLLPATLVYSQLPTRPWPVVLMIALGAWLAAIPLFAGLGALFEPWLRGGVSSVVFGCILLVASVVLLRLPNLALFVEQFALPALMAGSLLIAWGLSKSWSDTGINLLLGGLSVLLASLVPQVWLRQLLSMATVIFVVLCVQLSMGHKSWFLGADNWLGLHLCLLAWLANISVQQALLGKGSSASTLEHLAAGWCVMMLLVLIYSVGNTLFVSAHMPLDMLKNQSVSVALPKQLGSIVLAVLAVVWLLWKWPVLRRTQYYVVCLVLLFLTWFMPFLGMSYLIAAVCLTSQRRYLAIAAALTMLWQIGAFYYQLNWSLVDKALLLMLAGAVLGLALGWRALRATHAPLRSTATQSAWGVLVSLCLTLLVVNVGIWQKQQLITQGRVVLVELQPVDPRSLMQGDYMALNFLTISNRSAAEREDNPSVVLKIAANGVASVTQPYLGQALAEDEVFVQLVRKSHRWILVTDAYYFHEGEGERYALARYGEFRVDSNGKALLVGLRDDKLQVIAP